MTTSTTPAPSPTRSFARRRMGTIVAGSTVILLSLAGCSDEQRRDLGEVDVREVLEGHVEQAVADQDEGPEDGVDCASEIDLESHVAGRCEGTTTSGDAVIGRFDGTTDVDAETCDAVLSIQIAGAAVVDESGVDCFEQP